MNVSKEILKDQRGLLLNMKNEGIGYSIRMDSVRWIGRMPEPGIEMPKKIRERNKDSNHLKYQNSIHRNLKDKPVLDDQKIFSFFCFEKKNNEKENLKQENINVYLKSLANLEIPVDLTEKESKKVETVVEVKTDTKQSILGGSEINQKRIQKVISKIKFFWRGTNFNYPYGFMKLKKEKKKTTKIPQEVIYTLEDFSKKKINPTESFYTRI